MTISAAHMPILTASAISPEVIESSGIESTPRGLRFPWNDGVSATVWQNRPDNPRVDDEGRAIKYEFPKGAKVPFNRLRDGNDFSRMIIAEGTKQQYAVLSHAPADFAVYGMSGCWGYKNADLTVVDGREVFLLLDADFETNQDVWVAAEAMTKQLKRHGAKSVAYVATTGDGKEGVDDVLAGFPEDKRAHMLRTWLAQAAPKLPRKPKARRPVQSEMDADAAKLFGTRDKPLSFKPVDASVKIMEGTPAAITLEKNIALYVNGAFQVDDDAILSRVVTLLGNFYTPGFMKQTTDVLRGLLAADGKKLPERMSSPLLNCANGMVDLRTGQLLPHSPDYLSYVQVTAAYEPDTATPNYDAWLRDALRPEGATEAEVDALVADIEETAGTMLDPSRTPSKTLFLFGPSRSGKSTFLRLLRAVAGSKNTSAVTLHQLVTDQFAAANMYGKMLNVAADLSNKHVEDLSLFKMITGEDVIQANRKYGNQFEFTNQALVAFSANELPTVSEASRAYAERMKPFSFPNSFAGREDKTLEDKLMAELPGILARWVKAYGRFLARGGYGRTNAATQASFEAKSDRVVQFFQDMCQLTPATYGQKLGTDSATGRRDVAIAFNAWAERNGGSKMGERAFFNRFAQMEGVTEVRVGKGSRAFNVTVAKADDDTWAAEDAEPVADPVAPSGVVPAGNPWVAAEDDSSPCAVPAVTSAVNGPQAATQGLTLTASADPFAAEDLGYDI
ncbi:DNA primase [Streptomyces phage Maih]|uniref:DNA primase n=3 Tax=Woodruffvirus TP1604 TaxID=1982746 RepID=A0A0U4KJ86_9CAUD|nr:DNA primase [Streptomyces phage Maih]AWN08409.1 DNA primase [Streptomyces phage BayC]AWN08479.1 DNA primase [Streptomyces phage Salete]USH45424.1 DNA primase [Streptomyces phage Asis]